MPARPEERSVVGMTPKPFAPVLRTQADVECAWRSLIHPLGWPERRLWFMFVGSDGVPLPMVSELRELPDAIDRASADNDVWAWRAVLDEFDPGGRVALLLCRPGAGVPTVEDRLLATTLYDACRAAGLATEVIHLATDADFYPLPADDLISHPV